MPRALGFRRSAIGVFAASVIGITSGLAGASVRQAPAVVTPPAPPGAVSFPGWLEGVRREALSRGISARTVDEALADVVPMPAVVDRDRTQAELTLTLDQYLQRRLPRSFVRTAQAMVTRQRGLLRRVEGTYHVPASVVAAIWGLESNFGRFAGVRPTIPALATLAHEGRRAMLFREELFAALAIVDAGEVPLGQLKGSWAGAMGQPQFMPSTYVKDAVDFDQDGRRDIWRSTPDVLASIAHYLKERGWVTGQRWGREVTMPDRVAARVAAEVPLRMAGACKAAREMSEARPLDEWKRLGITLPNRRSLPASTMAASLVRVDRHVFLVYGNYEALLAYNCAHTYALSVAMLADRLD